MNISSRWYLVAALALGVGFILLLNSWTKVGRAYHFKPDSPEAARFQKLSRQQDAERRAVLHARVYDLVYQSLPDSAQFIYGGSKEIPMRLLEPARASLDRSFPRPLQAMVGLVFYSRTMNLRTHAAPQFLLLTGVKGNTPFCVGAVPEAPDSTFAVRRQWLAAQMRTTYSGENGAARVCRYFARYGQPGQNVAAWMQATNYSFLTGSDLADTRIEGFRSRLFRPNDQYYWYRSISFAGCVVGRTERCRELLTPPPSAFRSRSNSVRVPGVSALWEISVNDGAPFVGSLIARAERDFGAEKFARFWRSPDSFEGAFRTSFGVPVDEYVRSWIQHRMPVTYRGARMPFFTVLLSLLTVLAFAGVTVAVAMRRVVH